MKLDGNAHSVFLLHYHLVLVVKYRRQVFDDTISDRAKEIFEYIAQTTILLLKNGIMIRIMCIFCSRLIQIRK